MTQDLHLYMCVQAEQPKGCHFAVRIPDFDR